MKILHAVMAMAVIILVQMAMAVSFNWHAAEVFSTTAMSALFFYSIIRLAEKRRETK